jgi:DNA-binding response OmpR family regulator
LLSLFIVAEEDKKIHELYFRLVKKGYACSFVSNTEEAIDQIIKKSPDLILVESTSQFRIGELSHRIKKERNLPIIALVQAEILNNIDGHLDLIDDFVIQPYDLIELELRVTRLLHKNSNARSGEVIKCGDLVIDLAKYEVSVAGRPVTLTFKEYELVKFLASNRGRVFTREALLNKVWGYDYYGGDRTVDVHIKRLRGKIEDTNHTFIETVRNIGYRFKEGI